MISPAPVNTNHHNIFNGRISLYGTILAWSVLVSAFYFIQDTTVTFCLLYGISAITIPYSSNSIRIGLLIGMLHGAVHLAWPFIGINGLDTTQQVLPDILLHFGQQAYAFMCWDGKFATERQNKLFRGFNAILFLGNIGAVATTPLYGTLYHEVFVFFAFFNAFDSGILVASLVCRNQSKAFEGFSVMLFLSGLNYFVFRQYPFLLAITFRMRFFESYFITPVWVATIVELVAVRYTTSLPANAIKKECTPINRQTTEYVESLLSEKFMTPTRRLSGALDFCSAQSAVAGSFKFD